MTRATNIAVLLVTLLKCSRTQTSDGPSTTWFSANDSDFSPQPLTDIFSTKNPIIVTSSTPQPNESSSAQSPTSTSDFPTSNSQFTYQNIQSMAQIRPQFQPPQVQQSQSPIVQSNGQPPFFLTFPQGFDPNQQFPGLNNLPTTSPPIQTTSPTAPTQPQNQQPNIIQTQSQNQNNNPPNYLIIYPPAAAATPTSTQAATSPPCTQTTTTTPNTAAPPNRGPLPYVRIRMLTPGGSITNVNVNPITTTRRPTTTRRRRNTYDNCVNSCGGAKTPICAAPLATVPVDPDALKGFPSICHMACHNSFRKNLYEKVVDGRCGRLRNRIQTFDSNNKLKKNELTKTQYTVINANTVIDVKPLP